MRLAEIEAEVRRQMANSVACLQRRQAHTIEVSRLKARHKVSCYRRMVPVEGVVVCKAWAGVIPATAGTNCQAGEGEIKQRQRFRHQALPFNNSAASLSDVYAGCSPHISKLGLGFDDGGMC